MKRTLSGRAGGGVSGGVSAAAMGARTQLHTMSVVNNESGRREREVGRIEREGCPERYRETRPAATARAWLTAPGGTPSRPSSPAAPGARQRGLALDHHASR